MKIEDKQLIDFYHYNTTNYHDQLLYEKGGSFGYENNIAVSKHPNDVIENIDFHQILPDLSSKRDMSLNNPLDKSEILNLLYNSYRFNNKKSLKSPSPGGIYPLELYLVIQNVKGIEKGVYLYNREKVSLSFINNFHDIYSLNVPSNNFIKNVGCMIFLFVT
ncbi:hypothetical protein J32TS6_31430 [Virgibacillus pantothenticus]|uniref:hypothetical protein n=1 Tax=Virgibacillus pantothenticus TaxID=1473 RepID=UPI001B080014|nr:hypothetical protein [Virgibacillus pantothenticus]GIP64588.1 hypothetical protein J32TS6_31430 [Virgibacillus pantothenticus]